jgi:hypothetical protein
MTDDPFFARLRSDARPLRYEPDEATLSRIRSRIQAHLLQTAPPSVLQLLAAWFRPIVATAAAIALAAALGINIINVVRSDAVSLSNDSIEISMGGETYRVGD